MNSHSFEQARQYAADRLERELSPHLLYHRIAHTRDEVVPAVETLANMEGIQGRQLCLLLTAAWFHDLGYVEQALYHELISARIVCEVLPGFGYTEAQVETVRWAILATALPQLPRNLFEEILVDADLDVLGRGNFMQRNGEFRRELAFLGNEFTDEEWYSRQLKFVEGHKYFTGSARLLRDSQKVLNIADLRRTLEERTARD
jgi:uncharacterized protein